MRKSLAVLAVVAAGVLAWLVERWVVTDREAIEALLEETAASARSGDWAAVRRAIADDFEAMEPEAFVTWARGLASATPFRGWTLSVDDVAVEGDAAAARATVRLGPGWEASGRVGLARVGGRWLVRSVATDDPRLLRGTRPR